MISILRHPGCAIMGLAALGLLVSGTTRAQDRPASVQVARAQVRLLAPVVNAAGIVRSRSAADLAATVAGQLQWVAEAGTAVKEGDLVASLDTRELALVRAEQAARVTRARVNLEGLERELERLEASGAAVPRFNVDQARSNRDLAAADLQVARALLAQTEDQLSRSRITAPFAGVISERVRRAGEEVARGEIVARLVNPEELEIRLFVPLRHVRAVQPGQAVRVRDEQREFEARVRTIVPAGDARTQSFEVLVDAPPVAGLLAPGNSVQVELPLGRPERGLAVPRDAVVIRADGLYVYRVNAEQRAERIEVKAGVADGDWIAVEGGLKAGDQVIVRGAETLRGNESLQIVGVFEEQPQVATKEAARPEG
jgi:RND family efflux transporter MFP subunit